MTDLLSKRQVMAMLLISKSTLDVWRRKRGFPEPLRICGVNRWQLPDVDDWIRANAEIRANAGLTIDAGLPRPEASTVVHARYGQYTVTSKGSSKDVRRRPS